jgi:multidrug efflux pump
MSALSVSAPFIRRPIATSLLGRAVLMGGMLGYSQLSVSSLPLVDFPTVQVSTQLPGANPDTIAALVTAPLERQFGQIPSMAMMTSQSSFGISQVTLQFDLNRDIDGAAQDVQAAINAARSTLPQNLPYPPTYSKVNPADAPIVTLALTSPDLVAAALGHRGYAPGAGLAEVTGVGRVTVQGGLKPAVRIRPILTRLAAYGISLEDVRAAISGANVSGPKGSLDGAQQSYMIAANDQLTAAAAYNGIVIAYATAPRSRCGTSPKSSTGSKTPRSAAGTGRAGGGDRHPASAGRQRHRHRTADRSASCRACRTPCRRRSSSPS